MSGIDTASARSFRESGASTAATSPPKMAMLPSPVHASTMWITTVWPSSSVHEYAASYPSLLVTASGAYPRRSMSAPVCAATVSMRSDTSSHMRPPGSGVPTAATCEGSKASISKVM